MINSDSEVGALRVDSGDPGEKKWILQGKLQFFVTFFPNFLFTSLNVIPRNPTSLHVTPRLLDDSKKWGNLSSFCRMLSFGKIAILFQKFAYH